MYNSRVWFCSAEGVAQGESASAVGESAGLPVSSAAPESRAGLNPAQAAALAVLEAQRFAVMCWMSVAVEAARSASRVADAHLRLARSGSIGTSSPDALAQLSHRRRAVRLSFGGEPVRPEQKALREAVWAAELAQRKLAVARWRGTHDIDRAAA